MMRAVFMGTPAYALPALEVTVRRASDVLVVTRPDAPVGRDRRLQPSPVRVRAEAAGVPVLLRARWDTEATAAVQAFKPDVIITAAYGVILPASVLALPRLGPYNLHASLLPRWRGANPVAWAIRAGDTVTGVTLMRMDSGVDTGPIVAQVREPIQDEDTTGTLTERLAVAAGHLLEAWWDRLAAGDVPLEPQGAGATRAPRFRPEDAHIRFQGAAVDVVRRIRSCLPEPGPYCLVDGVRLKILAARVHPAPAEDRVHVLGDSWVIACDEGAVEVVRVQPAGKRPMTPEAFRRGRPDLTWRFE
jgi:methionyl-tRNA formyltransferase